MSDDEASMEGDALHTHTSVTESTGGDRDLPTDASQWSMEDKQKLLNAVVEMGGSGNTKFYKAVESSLKWENIKVDGKSAEECKAMYYRLIGKVRKHRTLPEIIADATGLLVDEQRKQSIKLTKKETVNRLKKKYKQLTDMKKLKKIKTTSRRLSHQYPDRPKRPPRSFGLYVMKMAKKFPKVKSTQRMTEFAKNWKELPQQKKVVYQKKYLRLMEKYREDLQIFKQKHPDYPLPVVKSVGCPKPQLPSKLYVDSRMEKPKYKHSELSNAEAVKRLEDKYGKLSDERKLKWIRRAKQKYQKEVALYLADNPTSTCKPALLTLSKEEDRIWQSMGQPVPAPTTQKDPDCPLPRVKSTGCPKQPLPIRLFIESRMEKTKSKHPKLGQRRVVKRIKHMYEKLSDEKKLKWIRRAMRARQKYQEEIKLYLAKNPTSNSKPVLFTLSKEEERIWHASWGNKFVRAPPKTAYMFFCNTKRDELSHANASERNRELAILYRKLTKNSQSKTDLQQAFIKEVKEYVQAYTSYYNSLSDDERSEEIAPEEALADYNKILQKPQTQKKETVKLRTAAEHEARNNKAKQSDPPGPNAGSDEDIDDPQTSSRSVVPAKRKNELQLDRKATQKKTNLDTTSQNPIGPAQNTTLDLDVQLSMATPQQSNVQVRTLRLRVRSPSPSTPSSESWQNSPVLAREMEIARRPPGFSGRGQSN